MSEYKEVFERTEIKYLLNISRYDELMPYLETIARVDVYGLSKINNIYYDTPDYRLIRRSLDKPLYKEKLRLRTYGDTSDDSNAFIEIKKKYDGIVYKRRISGRYKQAYDYLMGQAASIDDSQVGREIISFIDMYKGLRPAMVISYDRIAMAGIEDPDFRVTFDSNIRWSIAKMDLRVPNSGKEILSPGQSLMEIKAANALPLGLARKLSELGIFPVSFSKYGRGYTEMISRNPKKMAGYGELIDYAGYKDSVNRKGVVNYV
ncbi:polyphosphate polymerase domain-containing protein [Butyrivibrio sp. MC2013]|uniref:polyphosphate polymerase domain-containing protein n=1 Tax=Butyrivibrio sp. MC2013 TaxID=1280686 RepID=UPI00040E5274|nr:polyphosphate polymerase domain-containing protein [Butyrivibrio sp. MC2013]